MYVLAFLLRHRLGLKIALADIEESKLTLVAKDIASIVGESNVLSVPTDVSKIEDVVKLRDTVYEHWGEVRLRTRTLGAHSFPLSFPPSHFLSLLATFLDPAVTLFVNRFLCS